MNAHPIAIVYATWHGQAEKIARRIGDLADLHGVPSSIVTAKQAAAGAFPPEGCAAIVVVASVHFGRHPRSLRDFVTKRLANLASLPSAFVSVSGAAASIQGDAEARGYMHKLLAASGWQPDMMLSAAGAVPYSKYNWFTRVLMRFASRVAGRDSDSSRDYEYTDWFAVGQFVRELLAELGLGRTVAQAGGG